MAASSVEVARAHITLLAKMPGIAKTINTAIGNVDVASAGRKLGQKLASDVGKSLKDQVAKQFADATAAALDKQTSATKKLSDAEHALVKARAQHGTTSARVTQAEEKLEALRKSGKASAGELEKAEADLAKAQADQIGTRRAVESATNSVAAATRDATEASKAYSDALAKEQSKGEQALAWMPLANARIDELSGKWKTAGQQISGVGDTLTSHITKPAAIAGGAVATLVGLLGWKRLTGIDTARGQFQGLGMDADAVMKQVDAGVTNTSLSMAQGASLAVGILATGAVPLEGLEAQIKRVSNVSAAYGVEAEHAAYLLNNVLTKNKVTWGDLSQMQQNQIPIVTQLADYYGVAGEEIMKMARAGAISVEDLNAVIDQNAGAAAEAYAGTWQGVTSNILSNLGKIGAKFLEPTFNLMKDEAAGFLEMLRSDEFSTFAADIGGRIAAVVAQVAEGIRGLIGWWNGLSGGQRQFIAVAAGVLVALGPILKIIGGLVTGIGKMIAVGKVVVALFTGWKVAAGGAAIASGAFTGATTAQTVALKAGAIAQKVFNAAMKANPIIKIVGLISLLVGALIWFFSETELGQKIWGEFTGFLQEAWENVSSFFVTVWESYLKPVFEGIGEVFSFVWNSVLKPVFDAIVLVATWVFENILLPYFLAVQFGFAILGGILAGIWEGILKPTFEAIGAIFVWLYENVISPIIGWVVAYVKLWGAIFSWLWKNAVQPALKAIGDFFRWLWDTVLKPVIDWIKIGIDSLGKVFTWLWQNAVKPAIDGVASVFRWLWDNVVSPVWNGIKTTISNVWNNGIKPIIDTLVKVIRDDPKKAFEAARDGIKTAWEAIKGIAKAPVRFVVQTVLNDGLISGVNKFLPKGLQIPRIPLPKGFSEGGYTGNLAPSAVAGVVHGNEHVIRAQSRARLESRHPGLLDHMNQYGTLPGYKKGGFVHPMPGAVITEEHQDMGGYPGHFGIDMAMPAGTPIRAAASGVVNFSGWYGGGGWMTGIDHKNGFVTHYKHLISSPPVSVGQLVKQGQTVGREGSTGNSTGPHLHFETILNGARLNPRKFLSFDGSDSGDGGFFNILGGMKDALLGKLKDAFPQGGMFIDVATGLASRSIDAGLDFVKSMLGFHNEAEPALYDSGGWLREGLTLVNNQSGRPEPVLTGAQWDDIHSLAARSTDDLTSRGPVVAHFYDVDGVLVGTIDGRIDARVGAGAANAARRDLGLPR